MKLLFCGDVVGRSGRDAVKRFVPKLRAEHGLDAVIVNVDNAAGGFGIGGDALRDFKGNGIDVMTGGDLEAGTLVDEQWLLDLERKAFMSLLKNPLSQARIANMLTTGKPLRN